MVWLVLVGTKEEAMQWAMIGALLLLLTGCGVLDSLTGADDPAVLSGEKQSIVESASETVEDVLPNPWGWIVAGVLGYGAKGYRDVRKKQKEGEATA